MAKSTLRLDRKAIILTPTQGRGAAGYPTTTYEPMGPPRFCRRDDIGGNEQRIADALRSEASTVFTFNWFPGLTSSHRILHEQRTFDIISPPKEVGRRIRWEVSARERPAQTDAVP